MILYVQRCFLVPPSICFTVEALSTMLLRLTLYSPYRYRIALWPKRTSIIFQLGHLIILVTYFYCREAEESYESHILQLHYYISNGFHSTGILVLRGLRAFKVHPISAALLGNLSVVRYF